MRLDSCRKSINHQRLYPLYAALLSVLAYIIIFAACGILGGGNSTVLSGDLYQQYIAFIRLFLDALCGKGDFWYSFSLYLGSPTAATYAYYCLSPFNLLYLIPGISASAMTIVLIITKHALAAACFQIFCRHGLKQPSSLTILFSLCYSLCGFAVAMQIHIMWLDAIYILPILLLFIIRFAKGHSFLPLIAVYAYLFITNFYMGYIIGVFSALCYFASLYIEETTIKDALKKTALYSLSVLLAAGCCAIILLPAASQLLGHRDGDSVGFRLVSITIPDVLGNLFAGQMQSMGSPIPLIYCGLPVLLLLPVYFFSKKISRREKTAVGLILCFYLAATQFSPLYELLHCFEAPNWFAHRYAICICFLLLAISARAIPELKNTDTKKLTIYTCCLLIFYSLLIPLQRVELNGYKTASHGWLLVNALFLGGYLLCLLLYRRKLLGRILPALLSLLLISELMINGCALVNGNGFGYQSEEVVSLEENTERAAINSIKAFDDSFYRIRTVGETMLNAPSYHHYNGINTMSSVYNESFRKFMSSLGIAATTGIICDQGYTPLTDMLLGIKYSAELNSSESVVSANDYALPLAFMAHTSVMTWQPDDDPFKSQEDLLNALCGGSYDLFTPADSSDIETESINMNVYPINGRLVWQHISDQIYNGRVNYSVSSNAAGIPYFYIGTDGIPTIDQTAPIIKGTESAYSLASYFTMGSVVKSRQMDNGRQGISLEFTSGPNYDYSSPNIICYMYNYTHLKELYSSITSNPLMITDWSDGHIEGSIYATEDKPILYTTIPYDRGWQLTVDDHPYPTGASTGGVFLTTALSPGIHQIELDYEDPLMFPGELISMICSIAALLICLFKYRNITGKKTPIAKDPEGHDED